MEFKEWNKLYINNYDYYQNKIDYLMYNFQKSLLTCNIFGGFTYPYFFQKKYLNYDIYKKKQILGEINKEEVDHFEKFNPDIRFNLNMVFNTKFNFPKIGLAVGLLSNILLFRSQMKYKVGCLIIPMLFENFYHKRNTLNYIKTMEFLDYTLEKRISNERLNINKRHFDSDKIEFIKKHTNEPLKSLYNQVNNL